MKTQEMERDYLFILQEERTYGKVNKECLNLTIIFIRKRKKEVK